MTKNDIQNYFILILPFLIIFISCKNYISIDYDSNPTGSLELNLLTINESRLISPVYIVSNYNIIFIDGPDYKQSINTSETSHIITLKVGTWDIHIEALNDDGEVVESATILSLEISEDQTIRKTVELLPTALEYGYVDLAITWSDENEIITGYNISLNDVIVNHEYLSESNNSGTTTLKYTQKLSSDSYNFTLYLKNDNLIIGYISDVIEIYDNLTSSKVISLNESDYTEIPTNPDNLSVTEGVGCINVTWNDNSYAETGYIIERRIQGEPDFSILNNIFLPNASSYIDTEIVEDITYEYRVKAFNNIGESGYTLTKASILSIPDILGLESDSNPTNSKIFNFDCSDDTAIFMYIISNDPASPEDWSNATSTTLSTITIDTMSGFYYLHLLAIDTVGNLSEAVTASFILDNTPPDAPIFTITTPTTDTTPTWYWSNPDDAVELRYQINGDKLENWIYANPDTTKYTSIEELVDGNYSLYIQCRDDLNNWSESTISSIFVDNTNPLIGFYEPNILTNEPYPLGAHISEYSEYTILWEEIEATGNVVFEDIYTNFQYVSCLAEGLYHLRITVTDILGHSSSEIFTLNWDTTPPIPGNSGIIEASIDSPTSVTLEWTSGDDAFEYKIIGSTSNNISTISDALQFNIDGRFYSSYWDHYYSYGSYNRDYLVYNLTIGETYYFTVLEMDGAGNTTIYTTVSITL